MTPKVTLYIACSLDGYISRAPFLSRCGGEREKPESDDHTTVSRQPNTNR